MPLGVTKNYTITIIASDGFITETRSLTVYVQNPFAFNSSFSPNRSQINDGTAASRTFQFDIVITTPNPTEPFYVIDYGDNSPIQLPALMSSSSLSLSHTYATSGIYVVSIQLYNKLTNLTQYHTVKLIINLLNLSLFLCFNSLKKILFKG